jgi:hypothetical protein
MNYFADYFFVIWEGSPKKPHHYFGPYGTFGIDPVSVNRESLMKKIFFPELLKKKGFYPYFKLRICLKMPRNQ